MKIIVLSSQQCENKDANNGDCFIIDNGQELVLYDCGCEEYAQYVMKYMDEDGYEKVKVVLSHNDDDHFKGIPILVENGKVSEITTVLLLKYVDELIDIIDDGRKNRESIKRQITEIYDNIYEILTRNKINYNISLDEIRKAALKIDSVQSVEISGTNVLGDCILCDGDGYILLDNLEVELYEC